MDDIRALCRTHTNISGRQADLLKNIGEGLPFIADLAQAQASLYAPARDGSRLLVLAQAAASAGAVRKNKKYPSASTRIRAQATIPYSLYFFMAAP